MSATTASPASTHSQQPMLFVVVALVLGVVGAVAATRPEFGALGIAAVVGCVMIAKHQDLAVPIGMFLVYINSPVVAGARGFPKSLVGMAVFGALAFPVVYRFVVRRQPLRVDQAVPAVVIFALVQFLGCVFMAPDPTASIKIVVTTITEGLILFVLVTNAVGDRRVLRMSVWALVLAGGIMGGVPLHQYATGNVLSTYGGLATMDQTDLEYATERGVDLTDKSQYGGRIRLAGVIGEKNRFAQILVMLVPLCAALVLLERGLPRWVAMTCGVLVAGGIVVTFSRGAIAGLGAALFVAAMMRVIRWRDLLLALALASAVVLFHPGFRSRIIALSAYAGFPVPTTATGGEETSVQGRLNEMTTALKVFSWNPLLGVGPGMFGVYYEELAGFQGGKQHAGRRRSHNLVLNIAAEHGLLGLFAFAAVVVGIIRRLNRARIECLNSADRAMGIKCGAMIVLVLSYLATGMFLHFAYVRYFWLMMGVAAATATIAEQTLAKERASLPTEVTP